MPIWSKAIWQSGIIVLMAIVFGLSVNQLRPEKLPLVGDWSPEAQPKQESRDSLAISLESAEGIFLAGLAVFIDARPREQYEEGHIQGAVSLPWEEFDERYTAVMGGIPQETLVVTYCDGESCALSKDLALALIERGYNNVRVLVNGWALWQERNLPVETGRPHVRGATGQS